MIFRSFFKLLENLRARKLPFTLILRTFGPDAPKIAEVLKQEKVCEITKFHTVKQGLFKIDDNETDLYKYILESPHHFAIQDDYTWWFEHDEKAPFAKGFPIDFRDPQHVSIFFDDCAVDETSPEYSSVNPYDPRSGASLSVQELIAKHRIVHVDTLAAICDENYFIHQVNKVLGVAQATLPTP